MFDVPLTRPANFDLPSSILALSLWLSVCLSLSAQPVPHHFTGMTVLPDKTAMLSLDGSVANMFNLTGTISNQFMQMFDLYPVEASSNLLDWTRLALLLRTNNNPNPLRFQDTNAAGLNQCFYRTCTNHLLTAFPKPSGPFAVGTVDRVMVDPTRTNLYRYSPPTNAFMVTFWYPADPPPAGALPAPIWGQRVAADLALYAYGGNDSRWASLVPNLLGHRVVGDGCGEVSRGHLFSWHAWVAENDFTQGGGIGQPRLCLRGYGPYHLLGHRVP